jgi:alcohol dehydrogenase
MLAWQATSHGSPADALRLRSIAIPEPGPGELRVRVEAASLNPIDYKLLRGDLRRLQKLSFPVTIGFDACGTVDAVGADVPFRLGERVFLRASRDTLGAFAEFTVQPAAFVAPAPLRCSAVGAASLPLVALTTIQGLVDRAGALSGQRILIHAGSGGLGSFAVQYARQLGLVVDATTSSRNVQMVTDLGAQRVIAYDREDYRALGAVYDIVFDTLGGAHALDAFRVLKAGGCVVSVAGPPDDEMIRRGPNALVRTAMRLMSLRVRAAARASGSRYFRFLTESDGDQLRRVAELVDRGAIRPVVDRVFPFEDAIAALDYLMAGRSRGKVVLDMEQRAAAEP